MEIPEIDWTKFALYYFAVGLIFSLALIVLHGSLSQAIKDKAVEKDIPSAAIWATFVLFTFIFWPYGMYGCYNAVAEEIRNRRNNG